MIRASALLVLVWLGACGSDPHAVIRKVSPLSRATDVDTLIQPVVVVGGGAAVDARDDRVVLYDVTAGGKGRVGGTVEVDGSTITYGPTEPLTTGRDYQLVLEAGSVTGGALDHVDESESPRESVSWPFRLGFRIGSRPRVRAAYLESSSSDSPRVVIRFSQPMNPTAIGEQIQITDLGGKPLEVGALVWSDAQSVELDLAQALDPAGVYTLEVSRDAISEDGILLDGNDNGTPGEGNDHYSVQFTGSQRVIRSRLE